MKNILYALIFVFCSTLICEASRYEEVRMGGDSPIKSLAVVIVLGYGLYCLIKWFVSKKLLEKVSPKVTSKKKLETTFTDEYAAIRQKWEDDLRKIELERVEEKKKAERQNEINEWGDEQDRLESIRNPPPDEVERRKKVREDREKDEDHDRRLYGWGG